MQLCRHREGGMCGSAVPSGAAALECSSAVSGIGEWSAAWYFKRPTTRAAGAVPADAGQPRYGATNGGGAGVACWRTSEGRSRRRPTADRGSSAHPVEPFDNGGARDQISPSTTECLEVAIHKRR